MRREYSRILWSGVTAAFLLSCAPRPAAAQYLEPSRSYAPSDARYLSAGIFARDFRPRGSNTAPESLAVSYTRVMPFVGFKQGPVDFLSATPRTIFTGRPARLSISASRSQENTSSPGTGIAPSCSPSLSTRILRNRNPPARCMIISTSGASGSGPG